MSQQNQTNSTRTDISVFWSILSGPFRGNQKSGDFIKSLFIFLFALGTFLGYMVFLYVFMKEQGLGFFCQFPLWKNHVLETMILSTLLSFSQLGFFYRKESPEYALLEEGLTCLSFAFTLFMILPGFAAAVVLSEYKGQVDSFCIAYNGEATATAASQQSPLQSIDIEKLFTNAAQKISGNLDTSQHWRPLKDKMLGKCLELRIIVAEVQPKTITVDDAGNGIEVFLTCHSQDRRQQGTTQALVIFPDLPSGLSPQQAREVLRELFENKLLTDGPNLIQRLDLACEKTPRPSTSPAPRNSPPSATPSKTPTRTPTPQSPCAPADPRLRKVVTLMRGLGTTSGYPEPICPEGVIRTRRVGRLGIWEFDGVIRIGRETAVWGTSQVNDAKVELAVEDLDDRDFARAMAVEMIRIIEDHLHTEIKSHGVNYNILVLPEVTPIPARELLEYFRQRREELSKN